jgi:orotidine-5'-phosphate decarboxylase
MSDHFADRLTQAIQDKGVPICVGIDPVYTKLPKKIIERKDLNDEMDIEAAIDAIFEFSTKVLRIVAPHVPAVKINSAFFERYYWEGVECYYSLIQEATELGLEVIGDVKRGDIGSTAEAYADAHVKNPEFMDMDDIDSPDAITVNGFAGLDGIRPFADVAIGEGKGVFVWVRASNPSAAILQDFANADGKKFFELLAEQVATLATEPQYLGSSGFSNIGMIVGGTAAKQAKQLREQYPHMYFLVPGYGAQGASGADCLQFAKDDGTGVLISASRSILYAFDQEPYLERFGPDWEKSIEQACLDMKAEMIAVLRGQDPIKT